MKVKDPEQSGNLTAPTTYARYCAWLESLDNDQLQKAVVEARRNAGWQQAEAVIAQRRAEAANRMLSTRLQAAA